MFVSFFYYISACIVRGSFFFFQAEDGIRDHCVTGVQTCALPISIESRAHRCDQATKLKVRVKLSAREADAVRLPRHKAFPQLLRACGNVEHIFKWCFNGRRLAT